MSLPLLIRQIFSDLIINGSNQNFRFRSEPSALLHLKNEIVTTDLVATTIGLKLGDINHNSFTLRYIGNSDYSKNELGLFVSINSVFDESPIFKVNQATKDFTFISKAYITNDDGTTALIGSGGSGGVTQAQLDAVLQQAKDYAQTNLEYNYEGIQPDGIITSWHKLEDTNKFQTLITGIPDVQGYVRKATFNIDLSSKEWNLNIDSIDTVPVGNTSIIGGDKDTVSLYLKRLISVKDGINNQDAINKGQLDSVISGLNLPTTAIATEDWVNGQDYLTSSDLSAYATVAYVNQSVTNSSSSNSSEFYSQINTVGTSLTAYYNDLLEIIRYIPSNKTIFKDTVNFRVPDNQGWTTTYVTNGTRDYERTLLDSDGNKYVTHKVGYNAHDTIFHQRTQLTYPYKLNTMSDDDIMTKKYTQEMVDSVGIPVGAMQMFYIPQNVRSARHATLSADGWLKCDGASYNQTSYPKLAEWVQFQSNVPNKTETDVNLIWYIKAN